MYMTSITHSMRLGRDAASLLPHPGNDPIPPHMRKAFIHLEFNEADWDLFQSIYKDEDEATAALQVLLDAPPEIQILAVQLIELIEEVKNHAG